MSTDYQACAKQVVTMLNDATEKRAAWMGRILFLCATLFGILISLHVETQANLYIRLCFAVACALLGLGILLLSIASYHHIAFQNSARKNYIDEICNAMSECRDVRGASADNKPFFSICEIGAYICLLLSVFLLAAYSLLLVLL